MTLLRRIARIGLWFLDFLVLELTPRYVALAIAFGLVLGLTEPLTLQWLLLAATVLFLPIPLAVTASIAFPLHVIGPLLDPLFHRVGSTFLELKGLRVIWTFFYHVPIFPYTRFNNTVVFGSTLLGLALGITAGFLFWRVFKAQWVHLRWLRDRSPSWGSLSRTFIGKRYFGTSSDARWIRWEALGITLGGILVGFAFFAQGFSVWARPRVESLLSYLHGAPVIIEDLKINFWAPSVEISNVVLMRSNGNETLLMLDKLRLQLAWGPLLAKKFLVTDLSLEGVHLGTPGQTRFSQNDRQLSLSEASGSGGAMANSIAGNLHRKLREDFGPNPLRTVGEFGAQMELSRRISPLIPLLPLTKEILRNQGPLLAAVTASEKKTDEILAKFPTDSWREQAERAKANPELQAAFLESFNDAVADLQNAEEQIRGDLQAREKEVKALQDGIEQAVSQLKVQLHLPRIDKADASPTVFGPHLIHYLERISHWVGRSRRLMPLGDAKLVNQKRGRGYSIHFGEPGQHPLFLLTRAEIRDGGEDKPGLGRVKGYVANVTSDPSLLGKPMEGELEFEFPANDWKGGKVKIWIDHTGTEAEERIQVSIENFSIAKWNISPTKPLGILATNGHGTLNAEVLFKSEEISASGKLDFRELAVEVTGSDREITQAIQSRLMKIREFSLKGEIRGPMEGPTIHVESEWGVNLQDGLRDAYLTPIAAVDDAIRQALLDEIDPPLRKQETQVHSAMRYASQRFTSTLQALKQIREKAQPPARSLSSPKKKK